MSPFIYLAYLSILLWLLEHKTGTQSDKRGTVMDAA